MGQVMAALRLPRTTAWRAMAALVEGGKVEAVGETKGRKYRAVSAKDTTNAADPRWEQVLALASPGGVLNRHRVVEALGLAERTAGRWLAGMVREGVLVPHGIGRAAGYRVV